MAQVVLVRHGETEWSRTGRHTGRTDVPLTAHGERQARALGEVLRERRFALVLTSPLERARRTAELAGLPDPQVDADLREWDYGEYEGVTSREIRASRPGWYLWRDGVPGGETVDDVGRRVDRALERARVAVRTGNGDGDVALVAHGHSLRIACARWIELAARDGGRFALDTASVCVLGTEHDRPVVRLWNLANPAVEERA